MDYLLIAEIVTKVYKECHITSLPFDCFQILRHYGFVIYTYAEILERNERLYRICASYSKDAFKYDRTIAYNEEMNTRRISFTLMHELGHLLLNHPEETSENEIEADIFASNILAPRILIHRFGCRKADDIYNTFGLSHIASIKAINDYKDWFYKISRQQAPRKPTRPEQMLEKLFFPKNKQKLQRVKELSKPVPVLKAADSDYEISDEQLLGHLKNNLLEKEKAAGLGISIDEYIRFKYNFG